MSSASIVTRRCLTRPASSLLSAVGSSSTCRSLRGTPRGIPCYSYVTHSEPPKPSTALPPPRIDYRSIAENVVSKTTNAINRKAPVSSDTVQSISRMYKEHKALLNTVNAKRNARSIIGEQIQKCVKENDEVGKQHALEQAKLVKEEVSMLESQLTDMERQLLIHALLVPNDTHPLSPLGPESAAITLATKGSEQLPATPARDHVAIARKLGLIDLESASVVSGSSWYYLLNEAALLEMALTNYALSIAIKHGFTPVTTPDVVRVDVAMRCGFQPRDHTTDPPVSQFYHVSAHSPAHTNSSASHAPPELVLSGTAEIPLGGLFSNKIFPPSTLPLKVVGIGKAFRAEAGARGVDTRGLYRVHQFTKIELFAVTEQEQSEDMMEQMRKIQEEILDGLGIPYRILDMPTEELGASAYRKYDMEAWMPGRGKWGEVTSLSNCTDYQARRLHIRYRMPAPSVSNATPTVAPVHNAVPFAHTLNGTAAAIPRLIIALLENGAITNEQSGEVVGVALPSVLKPFWVGIQEDGKSIVRWT